MSTYVVEFALSGGKFKTPKKPTACNNYATHENFYIKVTTDFKY